MTIRFPKIILAGGLLLQATLPAATLELDLQDALERAPEANFQILLSQEALASQEQSTRVSRSGLLPQVSLEASQGRSMSPTVDAFSSQFPGIPKRFFNDRFDALIRARLSLYDASTWDDYKISKLTLRATQQQLDNTIQVILQQIAIAYFTHWRNQRGLDVIDANLERDRLLLEIAQNQQDAGVATALDVTRAEVRLASNELARLQQETRLMESSLRLKRILNLPLEDELVIESDPLEVELSALSFSEARFQQLLAKRADYQRLRTELEREELAVTASKRDRLPDLFLSGEWGYAAETWEDDMLEQWAIQVGVSMPIFEGFRLDAQTRLAESTRRRKEIELEDLRDQIESDYRLVLQTLESSYRQVEVARRTVALNEREFELARIRFEEGVADNSDVVDAQAALADAEDTLVAARFQYLQARTNLARAEGNVRDIID